MSIQVRDLPQYASDPGTGIRIEARPQTVEIGLTWDGAERMVVHVRPEELAQIAFEAEEWKVGE